MRGDQKRSQERPELVWGEQKAFRGVQRFSKCLSTVHVAPSNFLQLLETIKKLFTVSIIVAMILSFSLAFFKIKIRFVLFSGLSRNVLSLRAAYQRPQRPNWQPRWAPLPLCPPLPPWPLRPPLPPFFIPPSWSLEALMPPPPRCTAGSWQIFPFPPTLIQIV